MQIKETLVLGFSLVLSLSLANRPQVSFAQTGEQSADQAAFQDDDELIRMNESQLKQLENEELSADQQSTLDDKRNQTYRLYAEKRINELEKLKSGNAQGDKQIAVLQKWLKADASMRLRDQQTINNLRKRIAGMEQNQQAQMSNLAGDVGAMREAAEDARADQQFKHQMAINYFNELQSEMGPANMVPSTSRTTYGMGGMGFNGGQRLFGGGY